jgi:hypothetical protein
VLDEGGTFGKCGVNQEVSQYEQWVCDEYLIIVSRDSSVHLPWSLLRSILPISEVAFIHYRLRLPSLLRHDNLILHAPSIIVHLAITLECWSQQ